MSDNPPFPLDMPPKPIDGNAYRAFYLEQWDSDIRVDPPRLVERPRHVAARSLDGSRTRDVVIPVGWWEVKVWQGDRGWRGFAPSPDDAERKARMRLRRQIERDRERQRAVGQ